MHNSKPGMLGEGKGAIGLEMCKFSREMCRNEIENCESLTSYSDKIDVISNTYHLLEVDLFYAYTSKLSILYIK